MESINKTNLDSKIKIHLMEKDVCEYWECLEINIDTNISDIIKNSEISFIMRLEYDEFAYRYVCLGPPLKIGELEDEKLYRVYRSIRSMNRKYLGDICRDLEVKLNGGKK